ncbi:hypothetical protein [Mycobacterium sp.]|uniref:hypothetical protein n=1 Tax=Mycobacterium sp. TaxID=1785 RepID=UPI002D78216A|nr:hypothetical protein [Mycobacterium sp.]
MFTKLKKAAITAALVAAAAPAALLVGAGTAQAAAGDPEVIYNPHPGGLTATVRNHTFDQTQCTYIADGWIVRQVNLSPFGSQQLEFPGVPLFHPWDVNLSCDNGKSTHFVYWY